MTGKETIGDNHSAAESTADTHINSGMEENNYDSKERLDAYYSSCLSAAEAQLKELGERGRMLVTAEILLFSCSDIFCRSSYFHILLTVVVVGGGCRICIISCCQAFRCCQ